MPCYWCCCFVCLDFPSGYENGNTCQLLRKYKYSHQMKGNGGQKGTQCAETHLQVDRMEPRHGTAAGGWGVKKKPVHVCVLEEALVSVCVDRALKRKG